MEILMQKRKESPMVNRLIGVGLLSAGVVTGVVLARLWPEPVVSAQGAWQCRSWTLESKEGADAVGPWLGTAHNVELSTAGVEIGGRYALVACKQ
jgi:hypothetical protein